MKCDRWLARRRDALERVSLGWREGVGVGGDRGHTDQDLDPSAVSTAETTELQETRPAVLISLCVVSPTAAATAD